MPYFDRVSIRHVYLNALTWGTGNGLLSTSLVVYLIRDICRGESRTEIDGTIAWIIAAPRIAGLLRVFAPMMIDHIGSRKRVAIFFYLFSALLLCGIPLFLPIMLQGDPTSETLQRALLLLVFCWCFYHLSEYFGTIALWSWFGDGIPKRIRGRFLGFREGWLLAGQTIGSVAAGLYTYCTVETLPQSAPRWEAYLLPTLCGIAFFAIAALSLMMIRDLPISRSGHNRKTSTVQMLTDLFAPLENTRFLLFVLFGCWVQMSIGVTQAAQHSFSMRVLHLTMLFSLGTMTLTRIGQWGCSGLVGKSLDYLGNVRVMSLSLLIVAAGSLFYAAATDVTWFWVIGAAVVWIAWVGVNIGIIKVILDLAPKEENAKYLAVYFTFSTVSLALATLLGGALITAEYYRHSFLAAFALRLLAIPILIGVTVRNRNRKIAQKPE